MANHLILDDHYNGLEKQGILSPLNVFVRFRVQGCKAQIGNNNKGKLLRLASDEVVEQDVCPWHAQRGCDQADIPHTKVVILNLR